jgi:HAD domain in Swiss Army Knife RNA repair proteins
MGDSMKVLFLDIDGVVNCKTTRQRHHGLLGIDPRLAEIVRNVVLAVPGLKVVLSSSWRCLEDGRALIEKKVVPCFDITPLFDEEDDVRGYEIQAWVELHPEVDRYAILDDDTDFLEHQLPNFFHTSPKTGITQQLADKIVAHFLS